MKLGLHIASMEWQGGAQDMRAMLARIVSTADAAGFDTITFADHLWIHPIIGGPMKDHLEAYTTLGYIAAHTERAQLMALATAVPYRPAGLLAKIVTTLDVLTGGRAKLGIGAGDYEEEASGLGLPYPPLRERLDLLEETLQACLRMWMGDHGSEEPFHGAYVQMERPLNLPQSLRRPHPPILIAGGGEKRTLPLVARYGDACNIPPSPDIPEKLELLRELCAREGRDYDAIEKTAPYKFDVGETGERAKVEALLEQLRWLADMGIEAVYGWVEHVDQITPLEVMARDVIPVVAEWN